MADSSCPAIFIQLKADKGPVRPFSRRPQGNAWRTTNTTMVAVFDSLEECFPAAWLETVLGCEAAGRSSWLSVHETVLGCEPASYPN
jgi:hypothetical protein